jgi:vitamin B12 transporter
MSIIRRPGTAFFSVVTSCALALSGVSLAVGPAGATAAPAESAGGATRKDDGLYVITATRSRQRLDESLSSVTVIEREDIERSQARTLDELLVGVEGVAIARQGGVGQPTSVYLRGGESDHVLWMVDGVRIGSVTTGIPALQDLPLDTVERIEIVRGPRSSLYGADAMGGVVQIFTRRGGAGAPVLRLTTGSNGTRQLAAALGFGDEARWLDVKAGHFETDGVNACLGLPFPPGGGCFTLEPDRDPYRNTSVNVAGGVKFGGGDTLQAYAQRAEARVSFDSSFLNQSDLVNEAAGLEWVTEPVTGWRSTLVVGRSADESTSFRRGGSLTSVFNSSRDSLGWQNELRLGSGELMIGADFLRDRVDSDIRYDRRSRDNSAVYAQYARGFGAQSLALAARIDDNEQFGSNATGSLSWGLRLATDTQAYASVGSAFKAPSFNELYYPGFSNPRLNPERALTTEAGLRQRRAWGRWSVSVYRSEIDELIAFDVASFRPQNIARAVLGGIEGSLQWQRGPWRVEQSLGWLSAEDAGRGSARGRDLPRRPAWSGRSALAWSAARFDVGASVQFASHRYDDLANTRRLGGYAVVDLTGAWRVGGGTELQVRVANALDKRYETATLYPALGREFFVTLRHRAPR